MGTKSTQPSVVLMFDLGTDRQSAVAFDDDGEIVETVTFENGLPVWDDEHVTVCDHRGVGGAAGYAELVTALNAAEGNAALMGDGASPIVRVASEFVRGA